MTPKSGPGHQKLYSVAESLRRHYPNRFNGFLLRRAKGITTPSAKWAFITMAFQKPIYIQFFSFWLPDHVYRQKPK